jgi:adenylate cyclase
MPFRLTSTDGVHVFELRLGVPLVVGRALNSDLPLLDPTISRRHAEVAADDAGVLVRDLGSSNGTLINGSRVDRGRLELGDTVTFGRVAFELEKVGDGEHSRRDSKTGRPPTHGPTIVRQRPVPTARETFAEAMRGSGAHPAVEDTLATVAADQERIRHRLTLLLELSKALTKPFDTATLLTKVTDYVFEIVDVDRLSILLVDEHGELVPSVSRDRAGAPLGRTVPLSIARTVIADKVAILSDNPPEDARFGGESMLRQQVRSAICTPLLGSESRVLGVFYVDSLTNERSLVESDLDFLVAFSGIVGVAIENAQFAERIRRESIVRSNFERFFAPGLAERIASSPDAITLGGEKRTIAVLFCDIRGFTEVAASMKPDDTAHLLSDYFTEMVDCVFRHGGTLDKFMGDAVMAQWGAPLSAEDDADRALEAARDMMTAMAALNERWRREGRPELQIGVGLNYGEAFAGNIGSDRRLEFTVIGDTVNTASRLCAWAEPGEILVSDDLRRALTRRQPLLSRPPLTLRGKREPVTVFRVGA